MVTKNREVDDYGNENELDEDYVYVPSAKHLSICSNNIVAYIAGYIVYKLKKSLICETSISGLTGNDINLIRLKDRGNLVQPSDGVVRICEQCEVLFRKSISFSADSDISLGRKDFQKIVYSVMKHYTNKTIFSKISNHMFDSEPCSNHLVLLLKVIAENYLQERYSYAAKHFTATLLVNNKMKSHLNYDFCELLKGNYIKYCESSRI